MKRILIILISAVLSVCLVSAVFAEKAAFGGLEWESENGTLTVSGEAAMPESDFPWTKDGINVVTLNPGVTSVSENAFLGFALEKVEIPASVTAIGSHAFGYDFDGENYIKLDGMTVYGEVGSEAESYAVSCGFDFVNTKEPEKVNPKGELKNISWEVGEDGCLILTGKGAIPDYAEKSAPWAEYYAEKDGYRITSVVIGDGITAIGAFTFSEPNVISAITVAESVKTVGESAFAGCYELKEISLPQVVSLGSRAFKGLDNLETVICPHIESIGSNAFAGTGIKEISLPKLSVVPEKCFEDCKKLASVSIPAAGTVYSQAFRGCDSLTSVAFTDGCTYFGSFVFADCKGLEEIRLNGRISEVPEGMFEGCENLRKVIFSDNITAIGERAFTNCASLTEYNLTERIKSIAPYSIGYYIYDDDPKIETVYGKYKNKTITIIAPKPSVALNYANENEFNASVSGSVMSDGGDIDENCSWTFRMNSMTLVVSGSGDMPDYAPDSVRPWDIYRDYINHVTVTGIERIGDYGFYGMGRISDIGLSSAVKRIGSHAFDGTGVSSLSLPKSVIIIDDGAFEHCRSLSSVSFPSGIQEIGETAFRDTDLTAVYLPDDLLLVGAEAFGYDGSGKLVEGFLMKGSAGTVAENYAFENGIQYRIDGYIHLSDTLTGATITVIGGDDGSYTFSMLKTASNLEPNIYIAPGEYAYVYTPQLLSGGATVIIDGSAKINMPIPEDVNPLSAKLYIINGIGEIEQLKPEISSGCFVYSVNSLETTVISNADLTDLYIVNVRRVYADGSPVADDYVIYATNGAEFTVNADPLEGYSPIQGSYEARIKGNDIGVIFTYEKAKETKPLQTDIAETTEENTSTGTDKGTVILIVLEIVLLIALICAIVSFLIIGTRRRRISTIENSAKSTGAAAMFSDTVIMPAAEDDGIDIESLFEDDPDEIIIPDGFREEEVSESFAEMIEDKSFEAGIAAAPFVSGNPYEVGVRAPAWVIRKRFPGKTRPKVRRKI